METTVMVRWESEVPNGRYQYFDGVRWVRCDRAKVDAYYRAGYVIHMNPT